MQFLRQIESIIEDISAFGANIALEAAKKGFKVAQISRKAESHPNAAAIRRCAEHRRIGKSIRRFAAETPVSIASLRRREKKDFSRFLADKSLLFVVQ